MQKRLTAIFLLLLLLFRGPVRAEEEAENMNLRGAWTFAGGKIAPRGDNVNDGNSETKRTLPPGKTLRIRFSEETEPDRIGVEWYSKPYGAVIERYDAAGVRLGSDTLFDRYVTVTDLEKGTREIVIRPSETALSIAQADVFGPGTLPETYREFLPLPEKLDYMVIAAHPDDDVLFLGAVVPYLGGEEGLIGTIVYMTAPVLHQRHTEALNGAREMGLRYEPIFGNMRDVYAKDFDHLFQFIDPEATKKDLVRLIRQYRPTLLFTHGPEGEYGHTEHRFVSSAVLEAVEKAQDPLYDSWSLELYGIWQVQKLYWHDYEQAQATLLFDPDKPLASFGGRTAYEICRAAYEKHRSQSTRSFAVNRYGEHADSFNFFGLAYSAAGNAGEVRAGIAPELFSDYVPPTPAPTFTPAPTPAPTFTPEPSPTTVPDDSPLPVKTPAFSPDSREREENDRDELLLNGYARAAIAVLLASGCAGAFFWVKKWREE